MANLHVSFALKFNTFNWGHCNRHFRSGFFFFFFFFTHPNNIGKILASVFFCESIVDGYVGTLRPNKNQCRVKSNRIAWNDHATRGEQIQMTPDDHVMCQCSTQSFQCKNWTRLQVNKADKKSLNSFSAFNFSTFIFHMYAHLQAASNDHERQTRKTKF